MDWAISSLAHIAMHIVATNLSIAILLQVGSHPTQLLFHAAWERMMAQNPPAIYIATGSTCLAPSTNMEKGSAINKPKQSAPNVSIKSYMKNQCNITILIPTQYIGRLYQCYLFLMSLSIFHILSHYFALFLYCIALFCTFLNLITLR